MTATGFEIEVLVKLKRKSPMARQSIRRFAQTAQLPRGSIRKLVGARGFEPPTPTTPLPYTLGTHGNIREYV